MQKPAHLLLVEDDDAHAELVQLVLQSRDTTDTVARATDGEEALAYLRREGPFADRPRPDAVLLDLRLPGIDGHDVLRQIKTDVRLRTIPVVVLTTSAAESDRAAAYTHHANSYLVKPTDFDEFDRMIRDVAAYWCELNAPIRDATDD